MRKMIVAFPVFAVFVAMGVAGEPSVVHCPAGWRAVGPQCVTMFNAPPYTECPTNTARFRALHPSRGGMWVTQPGVCSLLDVVSPEVICPPPYQLDTSDFSSSEKTATAVARCIPPSTEDVSADEDESDVVFPDVSCPVEYQSEVLPVNEYAWRDRSSLRCVHPINYMGKVWCPNNFWPYGKSFAFMQVDRNDSDHSGGAKAASARRRMDGTSGGEEEQARWWDGYEQEVQNDPFLSTVPEWLLYYLKGPTGCAQVVAVHSSNCDEFACKSPYVSKQRDILTRWIHRQLGFKDEDVILFEAIPTGNDLRWTGTTKGGHA